MASSEKPTVLHEGEGWIAVHKPAGWLVHKGTGDARDLVSWARGRPDLPGKWAPVHRLDGETSGVVLLATPEARAQLSAWFAEGAVKKTYRALVHGRPHRKGIIRRKLSDARRGRPLEAVTRYRTVRWLGAMSLVEVRPESGRKHQIRRHLAGLRHPLVGDERYGHKGRIPKGAPVRLWLHALRIELPDGTVVEAPMPEELSRHLEVLEAAVAREQARAAKDAEE